jgi:predicted MFS family arabinose efflux permease
MTLAKGQPGVPQGLALILGSTLSVMAAIVLAPVLPQLMVAFRDVPNSNFWVPALVSVSGLGAALFSPFAGLIGDRYGRRIPLIVFCILFTIAGIAPLVLNDFSSIFLTRVVVGIASMGVLILSIALIGDCFSGASRDRWFAIQAMTASFSALVLLPLSGFLGAWLGWRGPLLIFLLGLPLAIAYWALFRNMPAEADTSASRVAWSALPWPWLMGICLISIFSALFFYALQLQIGLALAAVGVTDPARIGMLSGLAIAGTPIGAVLFVKAAAYPFGRLLRLQLLVNGVTLMMLRYCEDYRIFVLVAFVNLLSSGMMLPTFVTHVTRHLEGAVRGRGIGVWQAAFSAGQFLSVGATGLVMRRPGSTVLDAFWFLGASGVAVATIASLVIVTRRRFGLATPPAG